MSVRRVKIQDVAKEAGVSIGTVSRVFNNYTDISEMTKIKVFEAAKKLNYVPNAAARTLSSKNTKKVGMIFSEFQMNQKNAIPLEMLSGVHEAARECGMEFVLLLISREEQLNKTYDTLCSENSLSGAVVQGLEMTDPYYEQIQATKIPTVLIDLSFQSENSYCVSIDNYQAARDVVDYLYENGHRKLGMIAGKKNAMVSNVRQAGFEDRSKELGLLIGEEAIMYGDFDENVAYRLAENYLRKNRDVTAIFCASDLMAIGMIQGIQDKGLNVPKDISVVGFDDLFVSNYVSPSLTTVHQDMFSIGKEAGHVVYKLMRKDWVKQKKVFISHQLIVRNSVKDISK